MQPGNSVKHVINSKSIMNTRNVTTRTLAVAFIIATTIASINAITFLNAGAVQGNKFTADLSGQNEVPPVQTEATGMATFKPMGDSVEYSVNASNIQGVTAGHIHSGQPGENGPVVVTLFSFDSPMSQVQENGTISADMLEGPMQGKQISDLAAAMSNGGAYVNVHTEQNPNGEIRGQIMSPTS